MVEQQSSNVTQSRSWRENEAARTTQHNTTTQQTAMQFSIPRSGKEYVHSSLRRPSRFSLRFTKKDRNRRRVSSLVYLDIEMTDLHDRNHENALFLVHVSPGKNRKRHNSTHCDTRLPIQRRVRLSRC